MDQKIFFKSATNEHLSAKTMVYRVNHFLWRIVSPQLEVYQNVFILSFSRSQDFEAVDQILQFEIEEPVEK